MEVEILRSRDELEGTKPFRVETLLWGTKKIPETFGYLGYVPGEGFYLKMVCVEKDPLRTYIADQDPVYQDSAMEAFLQFESAREREALPHLHELRGECQRRAAGGLRDVPHLPVLFFQRGSGGGRLPGLPSKKTAGALR